MPKQTERARKALESVYKETRLNREVGYRIRSVDFVVGTSMQKPIICLAILLSFSSLKAFCAPSTDTGKAFTDHHECGSESSPVRANGPKVRLFYKQVGPEHPTKNSMFFFDSSGHGYFKDNLTGSTRTELTKTFGTVREPGNFIRLWGEYAYERVENNREPYFIDLEFNGEVLSKYRIRGSHITSPSWQVCEKTERNLE